ncbi:FAD-dependent monooxygenase [Streptomyces sp. NPDC026672]|uniref:FAD-dependent monooxygenase n=1 Tax=unclassified Streptomyces TaxID=2593676 RepID=UPI0033E1D441
MKVGIVGAGIAGLATAVAFARLGAEVIVYERPDATTAGAGISLFSNGLRALDAIGLGEAVRALGAPPNIPLGLRTPRGHWLVRPSPAAGPEFGVIHRGDLRDILSAAAPDVQFSPVVAVHSTATTATVSLDSGATQTFDLVVGAEGVGSGIRRSWPDDPGIRYAGYTAWRGITKVAFDVPAAGETYGRGERFGIVPMNDGRIYWYATVSTPANWSAADEKAELVRRFAGWHDPIPALLDATDSRAVLRNDIITLAAPLARFTRGRVVLVGDAAHAMTPDLGQGGNQALEDAITLAAFAGREHNLDAALGLYDETRRERTAAIARRSWQMGKIAQVHSRPAVGFRNALIWLTPAAVAVRTSTRLQAWQPPSPEPAP